MPTNFKQFQRDLVVRLGKDLEPFGFQARISEDYFFRLVPIGRYSIRLGFIAHPGTDFDITLNIGVRHDAVEDLCNRTNRDLTDKEKKTTLTVGGELGNLTIGRNRRWTIATESDVTPVTNEMMEALRTDAFPYFERFSRLEEVLAVCASDERGEGSTTIHSPFDLSRAKTAVAATFLLGDEQAFEAMAAKKSDYVLHKSPQRRNVDPSGFTEFVEDLRRLRAERRTA